MADARGREHRTASATDFTNVNIVGVPPTRTRAPHDVWGLRHFAETGGSAPRAIWCNAMDHPWSCSEWRTTITTPDGMQLTVSTACHLLGQAFRCGTSHASARTKSNRLPLGRRRDENPMWALGLYLVCLAISQRLGPGDEAMSQRLRQRLYLVWTYALRVCKPGVILETVGMGGTTVRMLTRSVRTSSRVVSPNVRVRYKLNWVLIELPTA